jgi:hypothetical protein
MHFLSSPSGLPVYTSLCFLLIDILQKHCHGKNFTHQKIQTLEQSVYVTQWSSPFKEYLYLINPEKYKSKRKLLHCLPHQVQELTKDIMTLTSNHRQKDLNAKPVGSHIVGKHLCTITCDWSVARLPSFNAHIALIEQNSAGIFRNTLDRSIHP